MLQLLLVHRYRPFFGIGNQLLQAFFAGFQVDIGHPDQGMLFQDSALIVPLLSFLISEAVSLEVR